MLKKIILLPLFAALTLAACGEKAPAQAEKTAENSEVFKFDKTSKTVNPEYTLFGLRHLVMNNRTFAKKYAAKYPNEWKIAEENFSRAENAFQTKKTEVADEGFRLAMEQYQVILKSEQNKAEAKG